MSHLILRQLYDGEAIEWPLDSGHPLAGLFAALEAEGYVARWDRIWPLRDRYRLTERGIATVEAIYRPDEAEGVWQRLRAEGPSGRRAVLQSLGYDPWVWPVVHDSHASFHNWPHFAGPGYNFVWEGGEPEDDAPLWPEAGGGGYEAGGGGYEAGGSSYEAGAGGYEAPAPDVARPGDGAYAAEAAPWARPDVDLDADAGRADFSEGDRADTDLS